MVSTTDFFYPLVDSPYIQGQIACANVLSDMYAMGIVEIDSMLMILGVCREMTSKERDIVATDMIHGFNDHAIRAGTNVTGGQTVMNPWPIIGGVAMSAVFEKQMIRPNGATVGDYIVLTKPLGTQVAVNVHEWKHKPCRWKIIESKISIQDADEAYATAVESMIRLNRNAAKCMHECQAHSATDVTGFGLLGHLQNMAKSQNAAVDFVIDTLPIIKGMVEVNALCDNMFRLVEGYSAETSGGILVCLSQGQASSFIEKVAALDGTPSWIIGKVVEGNHQATIVSHPKIIEV